MEFLKIKVRIHINCLLFITDSYIILARQIYLCLVINFNDATLWE